MKNDIESFYVEFEFKTKNATYWLPLFLPAKTIGDAERWFDNINLEIEKKYEVLRKDGPIPVVNGVNSKYRHEYVSNGMKFTRKAKLTIGIFELEDLEYFVGKTYEEHMAMVEATPGDYIGKTLATSQSFSIPVSVLNKPEGANQDFLVFDVIRPK